MKARKAAALVLLVLLGVLLTACGGSKTYADGTYEGTSSVYIPLDPDDEEDGGDGYGVATVTIENGVVTGCTYLSYTSEDELKDEDYGKARRGEIANQDYYNKAQRAVLACGKYAEQLVETGSLDQVDAISGATVSYDQFKEAVQEALKAAAS